MNWEKKANDLILESNSIEYTMFTNGDVEDIIKVILFADKHSKDFTVKFAQNLKAKTDLQTLENIFDFVKSNIKYVVDKTGHERIKSPGATWIDKFGDCKSHSVFVGSLLKNLGFNFTYRVVFYDPKRPYLGHIYCVAQLNDKEVIVDTVNTRFNKEERYWKGADYSPQTGTKISGISKGFPIGEIMLGVLLFYLFKRISND